MKKISTFFAALIFAITPALSLAKDFEGVLRLKMTASGEKTYEADYSIKSSFMRLDMTAEGQAVAIIADLTKMESLMLMPDQQMYMVMSLKNATAQAAQTADDTTIEDTGVTEQILGHKCTKYLVKTPKSDDLTELWATDELGTFVSLSTLSQLGKNKGKVNANWEAVLKGKNIFPLRVITRKASGKIASQLDIVSITSKPLPDSLFQPPAGFQRMDMGAMMQGMMGGR